MKLSPMLCAQGSVDDLTTHAGWIYEPKLDGIRVLCYVNKKIKLISRGGIDVTDKYPELQLRDVITADSCILDGEVIGYNKKGIPDFGALQEGAPASYVIFDILEYNGTSLIHKTLAERKQVLDQVIAKHGVIATNVYTTNGTKLWRLMQKKHMEGVVAKDPHSIYYPGKRCNCWIKIKFLNTLDCVIVGYTATVRQISSLALALYNRDGKLQYIGKVGTGFNAKNMPELTRALKPLRTERCPVVTVPESVKEPIIWVKPKLTCEVKYLELTQYQILRTSVFLRLRTKKPHECTFKDQGL